MVKTAIAEAAALAAGPDGPAVITLDATLGLNTVAALAERLIAARGRSVQLDASLVHRLGAQGLQVLLSAEQAWAADGLAFEITAPSERFLTDWRLFGAPELSGSPSLTHLEMLP
ncbi:MAG TPA: STAS domain-containing protein [Caulobacteraceae bacterium]|nr:STAS domain-containing protein [Caulobacteraceae bacterium]